MYTKNCEHCGGLFSKPLTRSIRDFNERARFCSQACKARGQVGFYRYWSGKKRPDLLDTGASRTMFAKGNAGICPPEKRYRKHGMANTAFYSRWRAMNQRCNNSNTKQYKDYGGRGIRVEWVSFEEFMSDMYESFKEATTIHGERKIQIERINNDGNYSRENCKWTTRKEQMRNTRNNNTLTVNGETKCLTDWAEKIGISYNALWKRLKKMSPEKAVGYEV